MHRVRIALLSFRRWRRPGLAEKTRVESHVFQHALETAGREPQDGRRAIELDPRSEPPVVCDQPGAHGVIT